MPYEFCEREQPWRHWGPTQRKCLLLLIVTKGCRMVPTHFYKEREYTAEEFEVPNDLLLLQHDLCSSSKAHNFPSRKSFQIIIEGSDKGIDPISHLLMVADLFKVD